MLKKAGLEETEITDPRTEKDIRVSTTTRILFRRAWPHQFGKMRNSELNTEIAKDFASNSNRVVHYFWIDKEKRVIAEIRAGQSGLFYISALRGNMVNILTVQSSWLKPRYNKSQQEDLIELGEG